MFSFVYGVLYHFVCHSDGCVVCAWTIGTYSLNVSLSTPYDILDLRNLVSHKPGLVRQKRHVAPIVAVVAISAGSWKKRHSSIALTRCFVLPTSLADSIPEGLNDRSQAIYCLVTVQKGNRPVEHGMIGSNRRATNRTISQPWVRIRPYPKRSEGGLGCSAGPFHGQELTPALKALH
jgi:hypothetical protein